MKTRRLILPALFLPALLLILTHQPAHAGSATWNLNPTSGDWNTAANWMPATVPNGPADIATFGGSDLTTVSTSSAIEVDRLVFDPGADAYTITASAAHTLTLSGPGIVNNSGLMQDFVDTKFVRGNGAISFTHAATAGSLTAFTNPAGARTEFHDTSTAGGGLFTNVAGGVGGLTRFLDSAEAGEATLVNNSGSNEEGGTTLFVGASSAGSATFVCNGALGSGDFSYGSVKFDGLSTAANGSFTANGGAAVNSLGGEIRFFGSSNAGDATFIINGGNAGSGAGAIEFFDSSSAGNATIAFLTRALGKAGSVPSRARRMVARFVWRYSATASSLFSRQSPIVR